MMRQDLKLNAHLMGAGAAWSSVLAAALPCLILGAALARRRRALRTLASPDFTLLARIVRFALPNAANSFTGAATFFFFVWATGRIGPLALAAESAGWIPLIILVLALCPGIAPLWWTIVIWRSICAALLVRRWQSGTWQKIQLI